MADILSDLAAALAGSPWGSHRRLKSSIRSVVAPSMFEPIDGSAFDIAGKGIANPIGACWSASMMLEHLGEPAAAARVMRAIERVTVDPACHTPDLGGTATTGAVTCRLVRRAARRQRLRRQATASRISMRLVAGPGRASR